MGMNDTLLFHLLLSVMRPISKPAPAFWVWNGGLSDGYNVALNFIVTKVHPILVPRKLALIYDCSYYVKKIQL